MISPFLEAGAAPADARRRRLMLAGAGALLPGLAAALVAPRAAMAQRADAALAPRVGDTWRYAYRSGWRNVAPRNVAMRVTAVKGGAVRDAVSVRADGDSAGVEHEFSARLEVASRTAGGLDVVELSPYLQAFAVPQSGSAPVAMRAAQWGTEWSATARFGVRERVTVPAGTFDAMRVNVLARRPFLRGQMDDAIDPTRLDLAAWYAPQVKRYVRLTVLSHAEGLNPLLRDTYELIEYRAA